VDEEVRGASWYCIGTAVPLGTGIDMVMGIGICIVMVMVMGIWRASGNGGRINGSNGSAGGIEICC